MFMKKDAEKGAEAVLIVRGQTNNITRAMELADISVKDCVPVNYNFQGESI